MSIDYSGVEHVTNMLLCNAKGKLPTAIQMNERDLELQNLVLEIQACTDRKDRAIRKKIDRLLTEISSGLVGTSKGLIIQWSGIADIDSIVAEAVNNTLLEALRNIDRYDSQYSVMQWIRGILHYRFQDVLKKYRDRYKSVSFDDPNSMAEAQIAEIAETDLESRSGELLKFLKTDPEGHLVGVHIKNKSEATLQKILLMRFAGRTFQNIAEVFAIDKHSTIASFHDRQLRKLEHYFRKHLC
jgi:DNA-directed RNA polymerase specialized sigma24 family protein